MRSPSPPTPAAHLPAARGKQARPICHNRSDRFCHSASSQQPSRRPPFLVVVRLLSHRACGNVPGRCPPVLLQSSACSHFRCFIKHQKWLARNWHSTPSAKTPLAPPTQPPSPPLPAAHFTCRPRQASPPACHNGSDHFCHSATAAKPAAPALQSNSPSSVRPRSAAPLAIIRPSPTSVFPTETYCNISPRPICAA